MSAVNILVEQQEAKNGAKEIFVRNYMQVQHSLAIDPKSHVKK